MTKTKRPGGRHRRRTERAAVVTAVPLAVLLTLGVGSTYAAPQDYVIAPDTAQPGTTDATPDPPPPREREFLLGFTPSPRVQQSTWRSYNDFRNGQQQPSQRIPDSTTPPTVTRPFEPSPPPTIQRSTIAPIDAPEGTVLIGAQTFTRPDWLDPRTARQFNNSASALQADGANALVRTGFVDAPQADRAAAGAATGLVTGAAVGAATLGVPSAAIGAVGGALVGLGIGSATVPFTWWVPGIGWVFGPGLGAAIGAGTGAAALGIPAAVVGAGIGGAVGGALGATALGGQQTVITEPAPSPWPSDQPPPPVVHQVWSDVAPVVNSAVHDVIGAAPPHAEHARQTVATIPYGQQVLDTADAAIARAAPVVQQGVTALNDALPVAQVSAAIGPLL